MRKSASPPRKPSVFGRYKHWWFFAGGMAAGMALLVCAVCAAFWWEFEYVPARLAEAPKQYEQAMRLEKEGKYRDAFLWYRRAADNGDVRAMMVVGGAYHRSNLDFFVVPDGEQAAKYFLRAAEKGDTDGMTLVGIYYEIGRGVTQNDQEAMRWYRRAADAGNAAGIRALIEVYKEGRFGQPKSAEYVRYWREQLAKAKPLNKDWERPIKRHW